MLTHHEGWAYHWINIIYAVVVSIILAVIVVRVYAKRQMIPGQGQNVVEMAVEGMYNFLYSILGKDAKTYPAVSRDALLLYPVHELDGDRARRTFAVDHRSISRPHWRFWSFSIRSTPASRDWEWSAILIT